MRQIPEKQKFQFNFDGYSAIITNAIGPSSTACVAEYGIERQGK
jgi:hypothetical protein